MKLFACRGKPIQHFFPPKKDVKFAINLVTVLDVSAVKEIADRSEKR